VADNDLMGLFQKHLAREAHRGFGDIELRATAAISPISRAQMQAADNLLDKAYRALRAGDRERATSMAQRAVTLPYDDHEGAYPAAWEAHMTMFMTLTDAAERDETELWLDAALDTLSAAPVDAQCTIRDCLVTIAKDYQLSRHEERRIKAAVAEVPARTPLPDMGPRAELSATLVLEVFESIVRFEDAFEQRMTSAT
jgi:hypothetical protein